MADLPTRPPGRLSRRVFLALPFLAPTAALVAARSSTEHRFHYDYVLGTSLDMAVWSTRASDADAVHRAVLDEIDRLAGILSTYSPLSEISRFEHSSGSFFCSSELFEVLSAYDEWERRTGGALSIDAGAGHLRLSPSQRLAVRDTNASARPMRGAMLNVDALGKAFIVDRALAAGRRAAPGAEGMLVNIGGDLAMTGPAQHVRVMNPHEPFDNAEPLTMASVANRAVATSGTYARGTHLYHSGDRTSATLAGATVIAPDCVTANALATAACVMSESAALALVDRTSGAAALFVHPDGAARRTPRFALYEQTRPAAAPPVGEWPAGSQLSVDLTITGYQGFRVRRPYVAVWAEDQAGHLVRLLAVWGSSPRYLMDLPAFWNLVNRDRSVLYAYTRATRDPGRYRLAWDGLDDRNKPLPPGTYRIVVEVNQEHASYARESGTIACGAAPSTGTIPGTENFKAVALTYGPRASFA